MTTQVDNHQADQPLSPEQKAAIKAKQVRDQELKDLRAVLSTGEGRRVFWRMLEHCGVFRSIWHPSAIIHHNAGRQDVGHFIMAEICNADQDLLLKMMTESKGDKDV